MRISEDEQIGFALSTIVFLIFFLHSIFFSRFNSFVYTLNFLLIWLTIFGLLAGITFLKSDQIQEKGQV